MQNSKSKIWKQKLTVLVVSAMLGVSNILKNETKFIIDFENRNTIIKIEQSKPKQISHPNLLWKPKFYIKALFDGLNNHFKFN